MKNINLLDKPIRVIVLLISIISTFYVAYNVRHEGYDQLYLLPLTFGLVFVFFISPILFKKINLFIMVFTCISFTRYIILPLLIVKADWYGGRSFIPPVADSFDLALKLMTYELIIASLFIYILFRRLEPNEKVIEKKIKLPNSYFVYWVFIAFSLLLLGVSPEAINTFAFIFPRENMMDFGEGSSIVTITTYSLITAKYLLFLMLITFFYKKYLINNNKIYIFFSFLAVLFNMSIMFGDNRSDFIITSIVSMVLYYKLYPKASKAPVIILIITMIIIIGAITTHRSSVTYTGGENALVDFTDTLQIYLGGPYNVAIATEVASINHEARIPSNMLYDMFRPAIGINMILKDLEGFEFSNYLFNERIFFSDHVSQIMPMIGQGYFYFWFWFSPIFIIGFIIFVYYLLKTVRRVNRIELVFFLSIPITRIGFAMGQNTGILINDTSFFLLLNLIVYYLNNKIILHKKEY